jgi:two-component system, chemotaxis family, protein-glutamate methylesterase/glutaminase
MPPQARVLIVDDSRIFRSALAECLDGQEGIEVVGSVFNGEKALEFIQASPPDVVTLDVEMPGMGGLKTLEAIQCMNAARSPGTEVGVIMVSAFTKRGADVTVQALRTGAFDFVTKPSGPQQEENLRILRHEMLAKIHLFLAGRKRKSPAQKDLSQSTRSQITTTFADRPHRHRSTSKRATRVVVIAASTGGPKALETLLPDLIKRIDLPILVVQHMPPRFTLSLAESLARLSQETVLEAGDGDAIHVKTAYIAPGGMHMLLRAEGGQLVIGLTDQPPENGCRPAADVLFRSAASAYGEGVVAIILTGMGRDGTAGLGAIKRAGGYAIVQDEATSVVWGMPGSAVEAGLADEVLPLEDIAAAVESLVSRNNTD